VRLNASHGKYISNHYPDAMYENYDALTGEGNDDSSYTWTSALYLLLKDLL